MRKNSIRKDLTDEFILYNSAEAMEILQITRPTFARYLKTGRLKGYKVGGIWRFTKDDIINCIKYNGNSPTDHEGE